MKWLVLRADKALAVVTNDADAGMISVKISINDVSLNGLKDYKKFPAWSKKAPRRMKCANIRLFIF
jgi:hypothetical protein